MYACFWNLRNYAMLKKKERDLDEKLAQKYRYKFMLTTFKGFAQIV
jgi:hypothetical protein